MKTRLLGVLLPVVLGGCAGLNPLAGTDVTKGFSERALEVNDAYREERNAQILVNILRARDRQDRKYTSLSDLKLTPGATESNTGGVADLKMQNVADPWAVLSGSRTVGKSNNLELTISPNTKGADSNSVYRNPITIAQFQFYWNSGWQKDLIGELLIARLTPLITFPPAPPTGQQPSAADIAKTAAVQEILNKLLATSLAPYTVLASNGKLIHCFDPKICPLAKPPKDDEPAGAPTPKRGARPPSPPAEQKEEKEEKDKKPVGYEVDLKSELPAVATTPIELRKTYRLTDLLEPRLLDDRNLSEGAAPTNRLLFCRQEAVDVAVRMPASGAAKRDVIPHDVYRCQTQPISSSVCTKLGDNGKCIETEWQSLTTSVFLVTKTGVYSIALNSIDDAIYAVGSALRHPIAGNGSYKDVKCPKSMFVCTEDSVIFSVEHTKTQVPLFALATTASLRGNDLYKCTGRFAAVVTYADGATYFAGPPQAFTDEVDKRVGQDDCHLPDGSGTVMTLLGELIELNQVPVKLTSSTVLFRE